MEKKFELKFKDILYNYTLFSDITQNLCKSSSETKKEYYIKNKLTSYVERKKFLFSNGLNFLFFSSFVYYCFKGNKPLKKVFFGLFYSANIPFILNYGSHLGILFSLKKVIKDFESMENTKSSFIIKKAIKNIELGKKSDSEILNELFYEEDKIVEEERSFLKNNYFDKNFEKYKIGADNKYQLFKKKEEYNDKIPLLPDCLNIFFTKIIYFSITRYFKRLSIYLGLKKEEEF